MTCEYFNLFFQSKYFGFTANYRGGVKDSLSIKLATSDGFVICFKADYRLQPLMPFMVPFI